MPPRIFVLYIRVAPLDSLAERTGTASAVGRLMLQLLGAFAEFERSVIRERCDAGRPEARVRDVQFGRPTKVCPAK
jgi:DNA invertase Pin-like site-specific DNA recombinase